eukprot:TRINITY_DN2262_c0_g1_i1.p1 TRINITY_DN2262_c0_g1~~TRINITY_DN2262_c0_g1_i1.p1  ORF type:complete len:233 (+),score=32.07 TRINITY_DN2262_c0_g1_i1:274-972(+)
MKKTAENYDLLMKLIIVGDSGTGKSCLLHRFIEDRFVEDQTHTIGVEFGAKIVTILGTKVKLQIWDTAGQERYRSVTRSYYRGAAGCLLAYDITCRQSYEHVPQWLSAARSLAGPDVVVMLIGNKADQADEDAQSNQSKRKVTHLEASQFAQDNNIMMLETSAITGEYVEEAFIKVAKQVLLRQRETGEGETAEQHKLTSPRVELGNQPTKKGCRCGGGPPPRTEDVDDADD